MPQSGRSRPFTYTFYPQGNSNPANSQPLPVNPFRPVEFENEFFKGVIRIVHDTGSEPGPQPEHEPGKDVERLGLQLHIQGRFKPAITNGGGKVVLWAGGELTEPLKLGFITRQIMGVCAQFAKKKTEGRVNVSIGNKTEVPFLSFPIGQVLTCIVTPKGQVPPKLGSAELAGVKWKLVKDIDINSDDTFTFLYSTGYVDLCSWEMLKVPGVSPLALENILGDVSSARIFFYDLTRAGSHASWRDGLVFEWLFSRGSVGDSWFEEENASGARTPLSEASDPSEASDEDEENDLIGNYHDNDNNDKDSEGSEASDSSDGSFDVDEDELSKAESEVLQEIRSWRPRDRSVSCGRESIAFPYYIETIDRRRKRRLAWWCVFSIIEEGIPDVFWNAKVFSELAGLLGRPRRWRTFRRGIRAGSRGAGCACYGVQTLELFRQAVRAQLSVEDSKIRRAILVNEMQDIGALAGIDEGHSDHREEATLNDKAGGRSLAEMKEHFLSAPKKALKLSQTHRNNSRKCPLFPPRFFAMQNSRACELAFKSASEGRTSCLREGLVGSVQFEGRVCEELLRLDTSGAVRCFAPYDADCPRFRLFPLDILGAEPIPGLFLGRFHRFKVLTVLRVFVFCCESEAECSLWLNAFATMDYGSAKVDHGVSFPTSVDCSRSINLHRLSPVTSTIIRMSRQPHLTSSLLVDGSRARRWRPQKRLVLNDRVLIDENTAAPSASDVEAMLKMALAYVKDTSMDDMVKLFDSTAQLKAVRFARMRHDEMAAFWINIYHCLLLHGWIILGAPKSRQESLRFFARVSYLVGSRPVSLKEIEQDILRIPDMDFMTFVPSAGGARAQHVLSMCCMRRRRAPSSSIASVDAAVSPGGVKSPAKSPGAKSPTREHAGFPFGDKSSLYGKVDGPCHGSSSNVGKSFRLLSMPQLPTAPWRPVVVQACLFAGYTPEEIRPLREDDRIALCLNRGNQSSLPGIGVFDARCLNAQLDAVARSFVASYVKVLGWEGRPLVILPHNFRCLQRVANMDQASLISFVWRFMSEEQPQPRLKNVQLRFDKYRMEPRGRLELLRELPFGAGAEMAVVTQAALALERLADQEPATEASIPEIPSRVFCASGKGNMKDLVMKDCPAFHPLEPPGVLRPEGYVAFTAPKVLPMPQNRTDSIGLTEAWAKKFYRL